MNMLAASDLPSHQSRDLPNLPPGVTVRVRRPARGCATRDIEITGEALPPPARGTAVVLSGAVARGAFEAGVLHVLAQQGIPITKIVAASAGALNGALLAAGIRAGRTYDAARALVDLWSERGTWGQAIDLSFRDLIRGRGLSSSDKLHQLLRSQVEGFVPAHTACPIELSLVVTALQGDPKVRRNECATSFESVVDFTGDDLDDAEARERLYTATTASAAFPGLFAPVPVPGLGDCLDGGAVNNAPIAQALAGRPDIGRVIVVTHTPAVNEPPSCIGGAELAGHVSEILVTERLFRDLREARRVNARLAALDALVGDGTLTRASATAAQRALGYGRKRPIEVIEIRPDAPLRGGAFPGLSSRAIRDEYIEAGRRAALAAMPHLA
jgi:predicted acylesterase/phospholipase RssA